MGHRLDRLGAAWRLLGDPAFRSLVRGSAPDTPSAPPEAQRAPSPGSEWRVAWQDGQDPKSA